HLQVHLFQSLAALPGLGHGTQRAFLDCSAFTGGKTWNEENSTVYPPESPSCFCRESLVLPRSQSMDRHDKPPCQRQTSSVRRPTVNATDCRWKRLPLFRGRSFWCGSKMNWVPWAQSKTKNSK